MICLRLLIVVVLLVASAVGARGQSFLGRDAAAWEKQLKEGKEAPARRSAAFALGKLGSSAFAAVGGLKKALREDKVPSVREAAAMALGDIGRGALKASDDTDLVEALTQALAKDADPLVRRSAALSLGKFGPDAKSALAALEAAVDDANVTVRQNAAWALGRIGAASVKGLKKALKDSDILVQRDAASSLGRLDPEEARGALDELVACCKIENSALRIAALSVLNKIVTSDDAKIAALIKPALADADVEVKQNAALTLANIGGPEAAPALPILLEALRDGDAELKPQAAAAIGNLGDAAASAVNPLIKALADPEREVRRYAALALGGIGEKAEPAIVALVKVLANTGEYAEARVEAATALAKIGPRQEAEKSVPSLLGILENPKDHPLVRERIVWALRVHKLNLANFPGVYPTFGKVMVENKSDKNTMLRYDCAYMLGVLQGADAPDKVLDVLMEFLKNDEILIYKGKGIKIGNAGTVEAKGSQTTAKDEGYGDGRVMAIQGPRPHGPRPRPPPQRHRQATPRHPSQSQDPRRAEEEHQGIAGLAGEVAGRRA